MYALVFLPFFWLRMLSVAEVHNEYSVAVGKVCGSCLVLFQRAMYCIVYCRVRHFSESGWYVYSPTGSR